MAWQEIPLTGGVVNTRQPTSLAREELVSSKGVRLRPGDARQVYRDWGRQEFADVPTGEDPIGFFCASFETAGEYLVLVTNDGTFIKIYTAPAGNTGSWTLRRSDAYQGSVSKVGHAHRGDEYFIGTNALDADSEPLIYVLNSDLQVRLMGLIDTTLTSAAPASSGSGSAAEQYDIFVYWIGEYNLQSDVESGINSTSLGSGVVVKGVTGAAGEKQNGMNWLGLTNPFTDSIKVYRHYCGKGDAGSTTSGNTGTWTDADRIAEQYRLGSVPRVGGLLKTISPGSSFNDPVSFVLDPEPSYPLIYKEAQGQVFTEPFLVRPGNWTVAAIFNDSVVKADGQVLKFSPPGQPEYQPSSYFLYFANERSDHIVGLRVVNNRLIAFMEGAVHKVNYLPFDADIPAQLGRVQESLSLNEGCVGEWAHTTFSTQDGEFAVWVSHTGLRMTDGNRWLDACPDFSIEGAGAGALDTTVLLNDVRGQRLALLINVNGATKVYHFYYHPSLQKDGRLRMMGPDDHPGIVRFADHCMYNSEPRWWSCTPDKVYAEDVGEYGGDVEIEKGWFQAADPFVDFQFQELALEHDADPSGNVKAQITAKLQNSAESSRSVRFPASQYEEASRVRAGMRGNRVKVKLTLGGHDRFGPMLYDVQGVPGAVG